jgi:hypothetical protein
MGILIYYVILKGGLGGETTLLVNVTIRFVDDLTNVRHRLLILDVQE